jgi:uncharacterized protein YjdB
MAISHGKSIMRSNTKKLQLLGAFTALFLLALGVGCTGFFQNPTLTSLTVGPVLTVNQGGTGQLSVTGTYSDGSTKSLSTGVVWSSSDDTIATVSAAGLVTGVAVGSATITAADGTVTGTTTVTVALANVTAISVTPTTADASLNGGFATFTAFATVSGTSTPVDVTTTATWTVTSVSTGTTADFSVTQGVDPATVTVQSTAVVGEVATITVSYTSGSTTYTATATVTVD